ncbi:nucleotidyltransferase domain-containing protein [bacterium]|nr:nucleotidyltransferase domain-containing protein [bacterium]
MKAALSDGLDPAVQKAILACLTAHPQIHRVILFGSRAKGNFKTGSDIDLAIEAPDLSLTDLLRLQVELDDLLLPYKIDTLLLHLVDNADLLEHINRVGIDWYRHLP